MKMSAADAEKTGIVFNIQKMSIHDGPGIRTTVFLKGCPLNCLWCANPESQAVRLEIACFHNRCVSCGYCAAVCPKHIISDGDGYEITDRSRCDLCLECVRECCTGAKKLVGEEYTVERLYEEILRDKNFYDTSGGGVTFSGGEPLMQRGFLLAMLRMCKEGGLHTAIETSGATSDIRGFIELLDYLDLVFFDIKHMDEEEHRRLTGVSNKSILDNLAAVSKRHSNIIARTPVIPGINDDATNICRTAEYAASLGIRRLELLPYHELGKNKYTQIGREYDLADVQVPAEEHMQMLADAARKAAGEGNTEIAVMKTM